MLHTLRSDLWQFHGFLFPFLERGLDLRLPLIDESTRLPNWRHNPQILMQVLNKLIEVEVVRIGLLHFGPPTQYETLNRLLLAALSVE